MGRLSELAGSAIPSTPNRSVIFELNSRFRCEEVPKGYAKARQRYRDRQNVRRRGDERDSKCADQEGHTP